MFKILGFVMMLISTSAICQTTIYIGQYSSNDTARDGVYEMEFDTLRGKFGPKRRLFYAHDPSYLAISPDGKKIAYADEGYKEKEESASCLYIRPLTGKGKPKKYVHKGSATCFVQFSEDGKMAGWADYIGGHIHMKKMAGNKVKSYHFNGRGPDSSRQKASHMHQLIFDSEGKAYSTDLGGDALYIFSGPVLKSGPTEIKLPAGCGPRHIALNPSKNKIYVLGELDGMVNVLETGSGTPVLKQRISALSDPAAKAAAADIHLSGDGQFLYSSHRGKLNNIFIHRILPDGTLETAGYFSSGGSRPRNFMLTRDGNWLIAANQESGTLVSFRRNTATGLLTQTDITMHPKPTCLAEKP